MQLSVNESRGEVESKGNGWFLFALVVSIGAHVAFLLYSQNYHVAGLRESEGPMLLPPKFVVKQVTVDPKTLLDSPEAPKAEDKGAPKVEALVFSDGKPQASATEIVAKPIEAPKQLVEERPKDSKVLKEMDLARKSSLTGLDAELGEIAGGFLQSTAVSRAQPVLMTGKGDANGRTTGDLAIPGRTSIDEALRDMSIAPKMDVPVAIPGNALFAYDSVDLGVDSLSVLAKIEELRRRFPDYIMVIVGHADALGTPEYNQRLSQRRAEAVRDWLVKRGMNPAKLETMGRGSLELLVDSTRSVEEQSPNRRVEVILRPPSQPGRPVKKAP